MVLNWVQWWGLEVVVLKEGVRLGLSETVSVARASHLLYLAVVYRFDFRFWFGRLCFALCCYLQHPLPVFSQSYFSPYFISGFVYWFGRLCFALCFIWRLFCHFYVMPGLTGCLVLCL